MVTSFRKKNCFVVCGGVSDERYISVQSARALINWICPKSYTIFVIWIDCEYRWHLFSEYEFQHCFDPESGEMGCFTMGRDGAIWQGKVQKIPIDMVVPTMHGALGEDGRFAGLCEMLNVPYVGSGVSGHVRCWDKELTKRILHAHDIPIVPFLAIKSVHRMPTYHDACTQLNTTVFIAKAASQGSSFSVSVIESEKEYEPILTSILNKYGKVLLEPKIVGDEIECGVLDDLDIKASVLGQIIVPQGGVYSYDEKYGKQSKTVTTFPTHLSASVTKKIQSYATKAFRVLDCCGMARVDFFVIKKKTIMVNEVNTLPGLTSISLYPQMWDKSGVNPFKLIQSLMDEALRRWHGKEFCARKR